MKITKSHWQSYVIKLFSYNNIYKYTNNATSRLQIFTNIQDAFTMQVLGPSRCRCGLPIDVAIVVELASRIQDLRQNEPCELHAHGVNPIDIVNFVPDLTHLSFLEKKG